MLKDVRKNMLVVLFSSLILCLSSCATTIRMNVTRPANINLRGAKTIAVLPFTPCMYKYYNNTADYISGKYFFNYNQLNNVQEQVIYFLQREMERNLQTSPYINVVDYNSVKNAVRFGRQNPADVYISGEIVSFSVIDEEREIKKEIKKEADDSKNPNKPKYIIQKQYNRNVLLVFNYNIVDSKTNTVIDYDTIKIEQESGFYDLQEDLPEIYSMISYDLSDFTSSLQRDIQPYNESKTITLLEDESKDPNMKHADKLASDGYLRESYGEFAKIYNNTGKMEAGYNAAMILMALGDFKGAESLMLDVYNKCVDQRVLDGLYDIRKEIELASILNNQINGH